MESKEMGKLSRLKKGLWKPEEDLILKKYVETHGEGNWATVSAKSGLMRGGKSCRLRWKNYLRPNIKRGRMSEDEKDLIIRLHKLLGNRQLCKNLSNVLNSNTTLAKYSWSLIAGRLPGRTDNEVKNYWNTHLNKRLPKAKTTTADTQDNNNKPPHLHPPPPPRPEFMVCHEKEEANAKQENGNASISLMSEGTNNNYTLQPPLLPIENFPFFYYDEPFTPYLDNLVFSEAFGTDEFQSFLM